jgi:RHS repeat-associated protein
MMHKRLLKKLGAGLLLAGLLISPVQAETVTYLHTDLLGSVVLETDQNRNVVARYEYEPYGLPRQAIADQPGYTGHVHDAGSGLVYMQQRYYDPAVGRFLSVDPVGVDLAAGANFNRYWYANNNPHTYVDPDGQFAQFLWGGAIGAGVEIFVQTAIEGKSFTEIDVSDVLVAAGAGALTGGVASTAALAAAKGTISVGVAVVQTGAGSASVGVTASLTGDIANGQVPDVSSALVEGAAAGILGAAGQRLTLAPAAALENMATKGGLHAHVANTTQSSNVGSDAAKVAAATSQAGSNTGEAISVAAQTARAKSEERR